MAAAKKTVEKKFDLVALTAQLKAVEKQRTEIFHQIEQAKRAGVDLSMHVGKTYWYNKFGELASVVITKAMLTRNKKNKFIDVEFDEDTGEYNIVKMVITYRPRTTRWFSVYTSKKECLEDIIERVEEDYDDAKDRFSDAKKEYEDAKEDFEEIDETMRILKEQLDEEL